MVPCPQMVPLDALLKNTQTQEKLLKTSKPLAPEPNQRK